MSGKLIIKHMLSTLFKPLLWMLIVYLGNVPGVNVMAQDEPSCPWIVVKKEQFLGSAHIDITYIGDTKKKIFYGFAIPLKLGVQAVVDPGSRPPADAENLQCTSNECMGEYTFNIRKFQNWGIYLITATHQIRDYENKGSRIKPYIRKTRVFDRRGSETHGPLPRHLENQVTQRLEIEVCWAPREFSVDSQDIFVDK